MARRSLRSRSPSGISLAPNVVVAQAALLLPFRQAQIAIALTGLAVWLGSIWQSDWLGIMPGLAAIVSAYGMLFGIETGRNQLKVHSLEKRNAALAMAIERDRIGRDLHDILGHSLTAVAVKSQLARRLVAQDPVAASEQISEVESIARQALTDVRATASGMREVSAASELASAQSVLLAAGVEPDVPSAAPLLGPRLNGLFGFAIREGVTNVVRHAEARACLIELSETAVRIIDDGRGPWPTRQRSDRACRTGRRIRGGLGRPGGRRRGRHGGGGREPRESRKRFDGQHPRTELPMITVMVADDQAMIRSALAAMLSLESDLEIVAQAGTCAEAIDAAKQHQPDVVLLDVQMPAGPNAPAQDGIETTPAILAVSPTSRIIIVTTFGRPGYLRRAMEAGAVGFMVKDAPGERLVEAVRRAAQGLRVVDPELAAASLSVGASPLSAKETEVLRAAAKGGGTAEIAQRVYLSQGTVRNHLSAAIGKVGAANRAEAVRVATDQGWL